MLELKAYQLQYNLPTQGGPGSMNDLPQVNRKQPERAGDGLGIAVPEESGPQFQVS